MFKALKKNTYVLPLSLNFTCWFYNGVLPQAVSNVVPDAGQK
jgi:hypothetical protein